jgi:hypothetical protein
VKATNAAGPGQASTPASGYLQRRLTVQSIDFSNLATGSAASASGVAPLTSTLTIQNNLALWLTVLPPTTVGTASQPIPASNTAGKFAGLEIAPPQGQIAYKATFNNIGDQADVTFTFGPIAAALNLVEVLAVPLGWSITPTTVANLVTDIGDSKLPSLQNAASDLESAAGIVKIAADLVSLLSDPAQVKLLGLALGKVFTTKELSNLIDNISTIGGAFSLAKIIASEASFVGQSLSGSPIEVEFTS